MIKGGSSSLNFQQLAAVQPPTGASGMVRQGRRHRPSITVRRTPCRVILLQWPPCWAISLWPSASLVTAVLATSQTLPPSSPHPLPLSFLSGWNLSSPPVRHCPPLPPTHSPLLSLWNGICVDNNPLSSPAGLFHFPLLTVSPELDGCP
jgi:hypothetical protein